MRWLGYVTLLVALSSVSACNPEIRVTHYPAPPFEVDFSAPMGALFVADAGAAAGAGFESIVNVAGEMPKALKPLAAPPSSGLSVPSGMSTMTLPWGARGSRYTAVPSASTSTAAATNHNRPRPPVF